MSVLPKGDETHRKGGGKVIDKDYKISFTDGLERPKEARKGNTVKAVVYTEWIDAMNEYRKYRIVESTGQILYHTATWKLATRFGMSIPTFKKYAHMFLLGEEMPEGFFVYDSE